MDNKKESFYTMIRDKRLEAGYTQEELSKKVGCKDAYISLIEKGKRIPSDAFMEKICDALKMGTVSMLKRKYLSDPKIHKSIKRILRECCCCNKT